MRDMALGQDANYNLDKFKKRYNSDLANDFGNLVNRITILIRKNYDNIIPKANDYNELDLNIITKAKKTIQITKMNFNNLKIHNAIESVMSLFRDLNKYLETNEPWKLLKNDSSNLRAATTLYVSINALYIGNQLLHPIMPKKTLQIANMLGQDSINTINGTFDSLKAATKIGSGQSPFPRIEE